MVEFALLAVCGAASWLPAGAEVIIPARPYWSDGALRLPRLDYRLAACPLLSLRGAALSYRRPHWQLNADTVDLDSRCLSAAPSGAPCRRSPRCSTPCRP
ncbi:hypothetical protein O0544_19595 [Edwardsiella anguillarum]|nr:hypothetical protein [Edwardsiella anguillarum]